MTNPDHLAKLNEGVDVFNAWRNANPEVLPDLRGAELTFSDLINADLTDANLTNARVWGSDLRGADLTGAILTGAKLSDVILTRAYLTDALLIRASLAFTDLTDADLSGADLTGADLRGATLKHTTLTGADLTGIRRFWNTHSVIAALLTLHSEEWTPVHILAAMIATSDECWEFWLNADSPCYAMFDNPQAVIDDALTILAQYAGDDAPEEVKERAND